MTVAVLVDLADFDVLTFDCYGTLIDWETGLLAGLREALPGAAGVGGDVLLEAYAGHEAEAERPPYRTYREVLATGLRGVAADLGLEVGDDAVARSRRASATGPRSATPPTRSAACTSATGSG